MYYTERSLAANVTFFSLYMLHYVALDRYKSIRYSFQDPFVSISAQYIFV